MNFIHENHLGDLELSKKETNGIRLYNLPDGRWLQSITSVTSFYNRQIFADWRKRIGIEEAIELIKGPKDKPVKLVVGRTNEKRRSDSYTTTTSTKTTCSY